MKKDLQDMIHELTYYIEIAISVLICGMMIIMTFKLMTTAIPTYVTNGDIENRCLCMV